MYFVKVNIHAEHLSTSYINVHVHVHVTVSVRFNIQKVHITVGAHVHVNKHMFGTLRREVRHRSGIEEDINNNSPYMYR